MRAEASVTQQGAAEIAHPHHGDSPLAIRAQDASDRAYQLVASVAHARLAEVPKVGQIAANLGIGEAQLPAESPRTGCGMARSDQMLDFPEIEA